jgi:DNA-binding CsgD family transcriptional regulator
LQGRPKGEDVKIPEPGPLLLERELELAALEGLLDGLAAGRAQVGLIEGSAGIGKSRLLSELQARAAAKGFRVLAAGGSTLEREFTFGTVRQLFDPLLTDPAERERVLAGAAVGATPVFAASDEAADEQTAGASFAALHGLYWLTANVVAEEPSLVAIDDLHWCDQPSLRFLAYLARRLEGLPILLAGTLRPSEPGTREVALDEIARYPSTVFIHPGPLSPAAVQELVERRLGADGDKAFAGACHEATGGNPLLLDQLLASLSADRVRPDAHHVRVVRDTGPRAVSRTVLARLGRLPGEAIGVGRAVAVLGERADVPAIAALAGLDERQVGEASDGLVRADILRPESPLAFVHPLVRDAVYEDLSPGERELQHARAATILRDAGATAEQVAAHLLLTAGRGHSWSVDSLLAAARTAIRRGSADSAVAYLRRALEEPPAPERETHVVLELGLAEALTSAPDAAEHLGRAYQVLDDPLEHAVVAGVLGRALLATGSPVEAAEVASLAVAAVPEGHEDMRLALEAFGLETLFFGAGDPAAMLRLDEHRPPPADAGVGAKMLAAVVALLWTTAAQPAHDCAELALAALAGGQLLEADTPLLGLAAILALVLADRDEADAVWDEALVIAHRQGSLFSLSTINLWRGFTMHRRGELAEAEDLLRTALDESKLYGGAIPVQACHAFLAATLLERGDTGGARRVLDPNVFAADGSYAARAWLISRLQLLVAEGRAEDALETADELERTLSWIVNPAVGPWRLFKAEALDLLERRDEALALAEADLELGRRFGAPDTVGIALRVLGTLKREVGLDDLREAVEVLGESSARLEHAKALAMLGAALRRSGSRSEAREPLREALDLAERCGARALVERAREELSATGARPRHTVRRGIDALTASELRIARLAADGRSNREIAQALFVTIRTVEMHLTHAYQKLEIASRKQLAQALRAADDQASD